MVLGTISLTHYSCEKCGWEKIVKVNLNSPFAWLYMIKSPGPKKCKKCKNKDLKIESIPC